MRPKYKVGDKVIVCCPIDNIKPEFQHLIGKIATVEKITTDNDGYPNYTLDFDGVKTRIFISLADKYFKKYKKSRHITFNFGQYGKVDR